MSNEVNPAAARAEATNQTPTDPIRAALNGFVGWSADLPSWQRDALRRLYLQSNLTSADLKELYTLCCQAQDLLEQGEAQLALQPLDASHVPTGRSSGGAVALMSLGCIQNVNVLADDQTLNFSKSGLTIIYGDNGSGKSGYGRVLKQVCRARDQETILPNAYATTSAGKPAARIEYSVGDAVQPAVVWQNEVATHPDLSCISVFDSKCASVHVSEKNGLAYTPVPLQLLKSLADACREIGNRLREKKNALETQIPSFKKRPSSHAGTPVNQLVLNLSASTQMASAHSMAEMSEQESRQLEQLKHDLGSDPVREIRKLKAQKQRIEGLVTAVTHSERILLPETADEFRRLLVTSKERAEAVQFAANEAFKKEPLPQAGSEVWKALWEAAREFSVREAYPTESFPNVNTNAFCVLCHQLLSNEAAQRLKAFESFVQQKVQQAANDAKGVVEKQKEGIRTSAVSDETLREAVRLLRDELDQPQICREVVRCLAKARVRARRLIALEDPTLLRTQKTIAGVTRQLAELVATVNQRIANLEKSSDPEQRKIRERALHELEDRIWLSNILPEVEAELGRLKTIDALDKAIQDTDTKQITRKATEVSRILVTDMIRNAFAAEIKALRIADRRIELTQEQSGYGSTTFKVSLIRKPKEQVADILSEGEHRCVAIAAFLAELVTAHNISGVIFDDPVSSLDHNYREAVADRLAKEAANGRQVIVFTHDIPFLMMLDDRARNIDLTPDYQCVSRASDRVGICAQGAPSKAQQVPEIVKKIERRLSEARQSYTDGRLDEWSDRVKAMAGLLRDGWERAVEATVAPVVRRYDNAVRTGGLRKLIVLADTDCDELNKGYRFCCTYCHTDSAEVNRPAPTPDEVKGEVDRLRLWFDSVHKRQKEKN